MAAKSLELFERFSTLEGLKSLIGTPEDVYFDCKLWRDRDDDLLKKIAKACCGLTNAEGGVLIIGMDAPSKPKDEPDVVDALAPVRDTSFVKARVLNILATYVVPGIEGLDIAEVSDGTGAKSGMIVVHVPKTEGLPQRCKDGHFYLRIGSTTQPMEYGQIADRFGRRPQARLALIFDVRGVMSLTWNPAMPVRKVLLSLRNDGAGLARFPSLRFKAFNGLAVSSHEGVDGMGGTGLPFKSHEGGWQAFRGGSNDVIYPGETRQIVILQQQGEQIQGTSTANPRITSVTQSYIIPAANVDYELFCEGAPVVRGTFDLTVQHIEKWPPY